VLVMDASLQTQQQQNLSGTDQLLLGRNRFQYGSSTRQTATFCPYLHELTQHEQQRRDEAPQAASGYCCCYIYGRILNGLARLQALRSTTDQSTISYINSNHLGNRSSWPI
jgi:hypothetical protein